MKVRMFTEHDGLDYWKETIGSYECSILIIEESQVTNPVHVWTST